MNAAITLGVCLATVVLCTLHFVAGIWLGWRIGTKERPQVAEVNNNYCVQLSEVARLSDQLRRFTALFSGRLPSLPTAINSAAEELAKAASLLSARIQSNAPALNQPSRPLKKEMQPQPSFDLGHQELSDLASVSQPLNGQAQLGRATRYRYETLQYLAACDRGLPSPSDFRVVQTLDLSSGGFGFFSEEQPRCKQIIVSLGPVPELRFFKAQVEHSRPAFINGASGYIVGCRFLSRMENIFAWDEPTAWIATKIDLALVAAT